jgi:hypothetical protein
VVCESSVGPRSCCGDAPALATSTSPEPELRHEASAMPTVGMELGWPA